MAIKDNPSITEIFPYEIWEMILDQCDLNANLVCKEFNEVIRNSPKFQVDKEFLINCYQKALQVDKENALAGYKNRNFSDKIDQIDAYHANIIFLKKVTKGAHAVLYKSKRDLDKIEMLESKLFNYESITHLLLINAKLKFLPSFLKKLVNLKTIDLSSNKLEKFPDFYGFSHLESICLEDNPIKKIPENLFDQIPTLKFLKINPDVEISENLSPFFKEEFDSKIMNQY